MLSSKALSLLMVGGLAFVGCSRERPDTTKTTTQTETTKVGTTSASTTETKVATAEGESKSITNRYVGTVTVFEAGKSIEVMTGNKDVHQFALDGKNDVVDHRSHHRGRLEGHARGGEGREGIPQDRGLDRSAGLRPILKAGKVIPPRRERAAHSRGPCSLACL